MTEVPANPIRDNKWHNEDITISNTNSCYRQQDIERQEPRPQDCPEAAAPTAARARRAAVSLSTAAAPVGAAYHIVVYSVIMLYYIIYDRTPLHLTIILSYQRL